MLALLFLYYIASRHVKVAARMFHCRLFCRLINKLLASRSPFWRFCQRQVQKNPVFWAILSSWPGCMGLFHWEQWAEFAMCSDSLSLVRIHCQLLRNKLISFGNKNWIIRKPALGETKAIMVKPSTSLSQQKNNSVYHWATLSHSLSQAIPTITLPRNPKRRTETLRDPAGCSLLHS